MEKAELVMLGIGTLLPWIIQHPVLSFALHTVHIDMFSVNC